MLNLKNKKITILTITILIVIIITAIFINNKNKYMPSVIDTIPKDKSEEVLETSQIEIVFKNDLEDKYKSKISIVLNSNFEYDSTWNLNILKIIPKNNLDNSKKYDITVNYVDKSIYNFTFKTNDFSQEYIQKNKIQATEDDLLYGKALREVIDKYPWYPNLPIKTPNYVVYYDFESEKFTITFLKEITVQKDIDAQIKDALIKIKAIGGVEPIQYYINK